MGEVCFIKLNLYNFCSFSRRIEMYAVAQRAVAQKKSMMPTKVYQNIVATVEKCELSYDMMV
ncbi:unnamed protein product [Acanthoscelides obtectus]|uniref:Uncharacterized protein n=1 Tax=Acanthoscelides obtectus TaxID=200917 RepID=A0A9P0LLJ8_ACAOB|nr:unnamed protein product [Acanthoscelides obtectus]CAK1650268.1 hypothetical protein AOBTE_LOCUS16724 [Acanthoscelides obtectus]